MHFCFFNFNVCCLMFYYVSTTGSYTQWSFLKRMELSGNSANSGNQTNYWSMKQCQLKIFSLPFSLWCGGRVLVSYTRDLIRFKHSNPLFKIIIIQQFQWKHLGKREWKAKSSDVSLRLSFFFANPVFMTISVVTNDNVTYHFVGVRQKEETNKTTDFKELTN